MPDVDTKRTIDGDKLAAFLLAAIARDGWVTSATITSGSMLEVTCDVPSVNGTSCDELLEILGLIGRDDVREIKIGHDQVEVVRLTIDGEDVVESTDLYAIE